MNPNHSSTEKSASAASPADLNLYDGLHYLHSLEALEDVPVTSRKPLVGPLIVLGRRLLKAMIAPILTRQSEYNRVNARLLHRVVDSISEWTNSSPRIGLSPREEALASDALILEAVRVRHGELVDLLARSNAEIEYLREETGRLSRDLERLREELARLRPPPA